jgi:glycosyl transferase family 92
VSAYLSLCAIYRDEADYFAEWIELHRLVGVERFFLYNNHSADHHEDVLAPYIEQGIAIVHEWPGSRQQRPAYDDCLERHRDDSRWIAFLDLDEFLFSPMGRPVSELLAEYESAPGVGVNWAVFGTSGHRTEPAGLVIENYLWRRNDVLRNCPFKSIVDPRRTLRVGGNVHCFRYADDGAAVDENHNPIGDYMPRSSTERLAYSRLRINHYMMKSEAGYRRKRARGRADSGTSEIDIPEKIFRRRVEDFNQQLDTTITMYLPELREALGAQVLRSSS